MQRTHDVVKQYRNMGEGLAKEPRAVAFAQEAYRRAFELSPVYDFAGFFAPYPYDEIDSNNKWARPTAIKWQGGSPGICGVQQIVGDLGKITAGKQRGLRIVLRTAAGQRQCD